MECFTHANTPAVGLCKTCGKGVCRSCVHDAGIFIACSTACEKEAADLHEMNQRGKKIYGIGVPKKLASGVIMWLLFAALFGGFGIYQSIQTQRIDWFALLFGAASLCIAAVVYNRSKESGLQC